MASTYPCNSAKILPKCQRETCLKPHIPTAELDDLGGVLYNTLPSYRNCSPVEYGSFRLTTSAFTLPSNAKYQMNNTLPLTTPLLVTNRTESSRRQDKLREPTDSYRGTRSSLSLVTLADEIPQDLWAGSLTLRRTAKPNLENERHRENSLRLCILEARGLTQKRRYYCDVYLDRTLYARTTSKTALTPGIFWAEEFDLNNLPNVSVVTISLYKEADFGNKEGRRFGTVKIGSKKYRKSQNQLVGFITIPTSEIAARNDTQSWFTLQQVTDAASLRDPYLINPLALTTGPPVSTLVVDSEMGLRRGSSCLLHSAASSAKASSSSGGGGSSAVINGGGGTTSSAPELRLRARYLSLEVLPIRDYLAFKTLVLKHSASLTSWLEPLLTVRGKEESASCLVGLHECNGLLVPFLTNLVISDIAKLKSDSMAFRSNTIATKAVECFVKLAASTYLHNLLYRLVHKVLACLVAWEVNPEKLLPHHHHQSSSSSSLSRLDTQSNPVGGPTATANSNSALVSNQMQLLHHLRLVWAAVQASLPHFPSRLIKVFSSFRAALEPSRGTEFCDNLISSCIFLRLICPALLSPSLFGLVSSFPSEPACQRNLTLLAKSLQSLANFTAFDDKEPYMRFLNGYVTAQLPAMRSFIRSISTPRDQPGDSDCGAPTTTNASSSSSSTTTTESGDSLLSDCLDEGYELASLHSILTEVVGGTAESTSSSLVLPRRSLTPGGGADSANPTPASHMDSLPVQLAALPACIDELTQLLVQPRANTLPLPTAAKSKPTTRVEPVPTTTTDSAPVRLVTPSKTTSRSLTPELLLRGNKETHRGDKRCNNLCPAGTSEVKYYTLHSNPGVRGPGAADTDSSDSMLVSLAPEHSQLAVGEQRSAVLEVTAAGTVRPAAAASAFSDYDEPYFGQPSGSEDEEVTTKPSANAHRRTEQLPLPTQPAAATEDDDDDEEPIYDVVPLSDSSSSMDELVAVNRPDLLSQSASSAREESTDSPEELLSANSLGVSRTSEDVVSTRAATTPDLSVLSPRLVPKQVTTASLRLASPPGPTASSPALNGDSRCCGIQPLSSQSVHGPSLPVAPQPPPRHQETPALSTTPLVPARRLRMDGSIPTTTQLANDHSPTSPVTPTNSVPSKVPSWKYQPVPSRIRTNAGTSTAPYPSTEDVENEVTRLRKQLQQSQATAVWATNRLSQKEAELLRLRCQILEQQEQLQKQQRLPPSGDTASIGSSGGGVVKMSPTLVGNSPVSSSRSNDGSGANALKMSPTLVGNSPVSSSRSNDGSGANALKMSPTLVGNSPVSSSRSNDSGGSPRLVPRVARSRPPESKVATATFDDLDDAMARLEQEQAELLQEQVRIRARLAASRRRTTPVQHPAVTFSSTTSSPSSCPNNHVSASLHHQQTMLRLPAVPPGHLDGDALGYQSGRRVRHQPPPQPPLFRKDPIVNSSYSRRY